MMDHTKCDHPSTSGARAKCRRASRAGDSPTTQATPRTPKADKEKVIRTPRDKDRECMNCGVERFEYRGRDLASGTMLYVGERCYYMIQNDTNRQLWDADDKQWIPMDAE
jgi:hypothetical protein